MKRQTQTKTIYVNPVERLSSQGRHKQTFNLITGEGEARPTVNMRKNKEFGVPSEYSFRLNPNTNKLITGLDEMEPNPFKGMEPASIIEDYGLNSDWTPHLERIVKQEQIKAQTKYEIMDNVAYNFYTNEVTSTLFSPNWKSNIDKPRNFLETFKIILYDRPNPFSDDTPRGRLAIKLIKVHPKFAKSKVEANNAVHDWYISEENEVAMEKLRKRELIENAIWKWGELKAKSTPYTIYQVGILLKRHDGTAVVKGRVNDITVRNHISDYLNDTSTYQTENIDKFTLLYDMLQEKDSKARFNIMYLIQQAINVDVILVRDGLYIWKSKSSQDNIYKHSNFDALVGTILREYKNYDPKAGVTNWYADLLAEVKDSGVWVE